MIEENLYAQAEQVLADYIAKHKLYKSVERHAILKRIYSYPDLFTAEELHQDLTKDYAVSLSTIYNNLEVFVRCNLVVRHAFTSKTAHYRRALGAKAQNYLICTRCGQVTEFVDRHVKVIVEAKKFRNFSMANYSMYLYGQCKRCRKKK